MVQVKDLTETTVKDLWQGVKELFWEDVNAKTLERVRKLLNNALEEELVAHLQATRYQRNSERQGYRNGYRERDLLTRWGSLKAAGTSGSGWGIPTPGARTVSASGGTG